MYIFQIEFKSISIKIFIHVCVYVSSVHCNCSNSNIDTQQKSNGGVRYHHHKHNAYRLVGWSLYLHPLLFLLVVCTHICSIFLTNSAFSGDTGSPDQAVWNQSAGSYLSLLRMRCSISRRKFLITPCTGQAAASPKAQMVWPSIWREISSSMGISL